MPDNTTHFAIGYMKGGMWAFGVGAIVSFLLAILSRQAKFLWLTLVFELLIPPIWAMKNNLEKGTKA